MERHFWHERWRNGEIGFHEAAPNPLLTQYFPTLFSEAGKRVFVPLCGMTRDISWLAFQGMSVVGIELHQAAVERFFLENGLNPEVSDVGELTCYKAGEIEIYAGDFFALTVETLGHIDMIYDRAALVALPEEMRVRYVAHLMHLTNVAPQLLICYEYDQNLASGPPFAILQQEIEKYYAEKYEPKKIGSHEVVKGAQRLIGAYEAVWHLEPLSFV